MNKIMSFCFLGLTVISGCTFSQVSQTVMYPPSKYLIGQGYGTTIAEAKAYALTDLAEGIKVKVSATQEYNSEHGLVGDLPNNISQSSTDMVLKTRGTFFGIMYVNRRENGQYSSVAILNKKKAITALEREERTTTEDIHELLTQGKVDKSGRGRLSILKKLTADYDKLIYDGDFGRILGGAAVPTGEEISAYKGISQLKKTLTFSVVSAPKEVMNSDIILSLMDLGFRKVSLKSNPRFVLMGGYKVRENMSPPNNPYFCEAFTVGISLVDTHDMSTIFIVSKSGEVNAETRSLAKELAIQKINSDFKLELQKLN